MMTSDGGGAHGSDFTESPVVVERIYIGGLDPPRLSARDMLERLRAIEDVEIQVVTNTSDNSTDRIVFEDEDGRDDALSSRPFLHITAVSKKGSDSALSIIAKQYHNVKWKGCKLAVEAAKPSFLDRLAEERQQRLLSSALESKGRAESTTMSVICDQQSAHINDLTDDGRCAISPPSSNLPRRLRIRKKFGEEAYHVDTKPWSVDDWANFHRARNKLKRRLEKHQEKLSVSLTSASSTANRRNNNGPSSIPKQKQPGPSPLMHRAVHIRFVLDPNTDYTVHQNVGSRSGGGDSDEARISHHVEELSLETSSSSSMATSTDDDDSEMGDRNNQNIDDDNNNGELKDSNFGTTTYAWSSDDDDDDNNDNEKNGENDESSTDRDEDNQKRISFSDTTTPLQNQRKFNPTGHATASFDSQKGDNVRNQTYDWSSDDDSGREKDIHRDEHRKESGLRPATESSATDEFAAGLYGTKTFDEDEESDDDDIDQRKGLRASQHDSLADTDLKDDVAANLNILSSIFSDIGPSHPAYQEYLEVDHSTSKDFPDGQHHLALSRTSVSGIMPRYDPLAESSKRFLVESAELTVPIESDSDKPHTKLDKSAGSTHVEEARDESRTVDMVNHPEEEQEDTEVARFIYKQDKLESVFRDAREAWEKPNAVVASTQSTTTTSGAFTFGFNLDNGQQQNEGPKKSGGPFSFAFDVPDGTSADTSSNQPTKSEASKPNLAGDDASLIGINLKASDIDVSHNDEVPMPETRRRGLTFPENVIQKYVRNFFSLNYGLRVMEDLDGFRNNAQLKEAWKRERQTLTLDWKRKRKYATTRIQKRVKL